MSKVKSYIMDIEEQVWSCTDLENIISELEHVSEAQEIVVELLELKTHFDIEIAKNYVSEVWNEFWEAYA
jgi:hypothetical protein